VSVLENGQKNIQVGVEHRLSAGDTDPLQPILPGVQKTQQIVNRIGGEALGIEHQLRVMAVRAAKIASAEKYRSGDMPREILGGEGF
jgi:hypothetical protein